jgi:DNA replicative helicase MCM subunit Mcm2 (Cdc46/Mcm family)
MSFLRERVRAVLDTFDSLQRQAGAVEKEELISALSGRVEADEAEDIIDKLLKEGLICSPRPGLLEKP